MSTARYRQIIIFIIPALYLVWSLQLNHTGGPFSLSRCDPEYPYLLNGLNCATLNFDQIGHTDHPGTPFQIVTGVFIRLTHLFIGQGPVDQDVLLRPEMYLSSASLFLSFLTFLLLYLVGRTGLLTTTKLAGAVILQSSFLLSNVLIDLPLRYNPDRILILYNLLLAILILKYLFTENYPVRKFALLTGILMGIGVATKFNFLPVLIIPFLLIPDFRNRVIYGLSVAAAFFISILPILSRFKEFRRFLSGVASHDGLYGQGAEQMINWKSFGSNFGELLSYNPAFTILLLLSAATIIYYMIRKNESGPEKLLLIILKAFIYASILGFILVAKHFKVYYFAPVLSLGGLVLFAIWKLAGMRMKSEKAYSFSTTATVILLIVISALPLPAQYESRVKQKRANLKTQQFYSENVTKDDLLFIEPTWLAGPMIENALAYGISYVAHRHENYHQFHRLYPNVITWEGADRNPSLFRTAEADPESILFSGRDIYVYSSPGRNAGSLLNYMDTLGVRYGTRFYRDTAFINPLNEARVIRLVNPDGWETLSDLRKISDPIVLSPGNPVSDTFIINGVGAVDYLEITLRIRNNDNDMKCRLIARSLSFEQDGIYFEDSGSLQNIGNGWQLLRLRVRINTLPAEGKLLCQVYYPGNNKITVQDLEIKHMGRR
jgi:hypothetical protein